MKDRHLDAVSWDFLTFWDKEPVPLSLSVIIINTSMAQKFDFHSSFWLTNREIDRDREEEDDETSSKCCGI
ncbi:hypothetical protein GCM10008013_40490 [Paenibacillus segetis]|uniref:Uncharacterized protein n=1 Tax=Paenibacillus segetis TaxID=1325360 RepID=A0ABQ1YRV5_9BACL|nr:hypothetical protein GCM10008013_40490 [Paenibacillus segetis]